jgi:hypothetical protein
MPKCHNCFYNRPEAEFVCGVCEKGSAYLPLKAIKTINIYKSDSCYQCLFYNERYGGICNLYNGIPINEDEDKPDWCEVKQIKIIYED